MLWMSHPRPTILRTPDETSRSTVRADAGCDSDQPSRRQGPEVRLVDNIANNYRYLWCYTFIFDTSSRNVYSLFI